ncbi:NAD(P)/FAD-dependent oxidoreductase [Nonomuraea sp. NPDC050394]|uniref:NAD(P)/FAD-dependent oxidoreductase n=1 Tax=Nonomuraea sp. NPDC050394 TaxID=3364363 RepID=UPI0037A3541C
MSEVVVAGGGYAGVLAANRLTRYDEVKVTLINPRPFFVERIRLHQLAGGSHDAVVAYRKILGGGVQLVVDSVTRIDAAERLVRLASGGALGYDYLIYAVGSGGAVPGVPGVAEFAYRVATLEEARRLRRVLDRAPATAALTVAGGGATGIEIAAEMAERGRRVTLACGGVLGPYLHPRTRRALARRLDRLGVSVLDGSGSKVTAVTREAVHLSGGRELPSAVTIWAAGFAVPDLAARSGLSVDAVGRLLTDETLTSVDDERIVAAGDAAAPSDLPLRMSCQASTRVGAHAADTVLSRIAGTPAAAVNVGFAGLCLSLGRRAGVFQFASRNDAAVGFFVGGGVGARLKEYVCELSVKHLAREARKPGSLTWARDDTRPAAVRAQESAGI